MKTYQNYICPRCEYPLVPVYGRGDKERRILALTCPEPYCDHIQVVPKNEAVRFQRPNDSHAERVIS